MGLLSTLFGGSTESNSSSNQAYSYLQGALGGQVSNAGTASNALLGMLGLGDSTAAANGLNAYKNSIGYDFTLGEGLKAVNGGRAAVGGLRSGATDKARASYATNLANTTANDYMSQLLGLTQAGTQAASVIGGAGQTSQSSGESSKGGLFNIAAGLFSDSRLKEDITRIGNYGDIGLYTFRYIGHPEIFTGVMADEVAERYPEALGPVVEGFRTVNYNALANEVN